MNNQPEDLKLVMIDPKMVELNRYFGLPHLLGQVSDIERIQSVLRWATTEMDYRYKFSWKLNIPEIWILITRAWNIPAATNCPGS